MLQKCCTVDKQKGERRWQNLVIHTANTEQRKWISERDKEKEWNICVHCTQLANLRKTNTENGTAICITQQKLYEYRNEVVKRILHTHTCTVRKAIKASTKNISRTEENEQKKKKIGTILHSSVYNTLTFKHLHTVYGGDTTEHIFTWINSLALSGITFAIRSLKQLLLYVRIREHFLCTCNGIWIEAQNIPKCWPFHHV